MKILSNLLTGLLIPLLLTAPCAAQDTGNESVHPDKDLRMLVFTKTNGYRHQSIAKGVATLRELAQMEGILLDHTEDSLQFNPETLSKYTLVVFFFTTGGVLCPEQEQAFRDFMEGGGNFMGIHAATDTEYDWPWYGRLVGAYFESHPEQQQASLRVVNRDHPSTSPLPELWSHFDEWYNFRDLQPGLNVLINLDESSYKGGTNGESHPIAWYHTKAGGRAFYTGLGHTDAAFDDPTFRKHLSGGMRYCLGID
ncbi:MAG: ThuA domain-containing protein [Robiginitalea sp.]|nr:ThuA domain-containing protein [Robiginitalea sp.]